MRYKNTNEVSLNAPEIIRIYSYEKTCLELCEFRIMQTLRNSWMRGYATSRKVTGSDPAEVNWAFSTDLIFLGTLWP
jgi:hypothetical protein